MTLATQVGILLALTTLNVGCYAFSWRANNHAMDAVREVTAALSKLELSVATRLTRIETKLNIANPE